MTKELIQMWLIRFAFVFLSMAVGYYFGRKSKSK